MRGSWHFDRNRRIIINTEVIGGSPAPNTYMWRVQQPDGSFNEYQPGEGPVSHVVSFVIIYNSF